MKCKICNAKDAHFHGMCHACFEQKCREKK
jgi:hypothetical protein